MNPSTFVPLTDETDECSHDCEQVVALATSHRPDLFQTPLDNPDLVYYVDGSSTRSENGKFCDTDYALVNDFELIESGKLPGNYSAQQAELYALTRACRLAENCSVNIFTDSRYAFGCAHDFCMIWKERGF